MDDKKEKEFLNNKDNDETKNDSPNNENHSNDSSLENKNNSEINEENKIEISSEKNLENKNSIDKNAIFFEKFEKSKKDFMKEKRKEKLDAKKSISSKNKGLGLTARLKDDMYTKKIWIIFSIVSIILLSYASVIMAFLGNKFDGSSDPKWIFTSYYSALTKISVIFSGIAISLIPLPYFYLFSSWFIGINNIHHSKYFVSTNFYILVVATILLLIVIPLSTTIFIQTANFSPLVN